MEEDGLGRETRGEQHREWYRSGKDKKTASDVRPTVEVARKEWRGREKGGGLGRECNS